MEGNKRRKNEAKNNFRSGCSANASWIEAIEKTLADSGNELLTKEVLKAAGTECAHHILAECEQLLGKKPETVDERGPVVVEVLKTLGNGDNKCEFYVHVEE